MFAHFRHLGHRYVGDVGLLWVPRRVILVVFLALVKDIKRLHPGNDLVVVDLGRVELRDIGLGDASLIGVSNKNCRAILWAYVVSLAVELGGVVRDRKEYLEDLTECNPGSVVANHRHFGMSGGARTDRPIVRRLGGATGITRRYLLNAIELPVDRIDAPKTPAPQHDNAFRVSTEVFGRLRKVFRCNTGTAQMSIAEVISLKERCIQPQREYRSANAR